MNKLVKTVNKDDLITEFLTSLNGILRLTDRELELMAELIRLDINYNKLPNEHKNIANRQNRKRIIQTLGITKDNLSRYIKAFKEKGILIAGPAEDELSVNKALIPEIIGDRVQVTIIIKIHGNNNI
jgi:hypothetical protein|nr:MAG TPA: chromosome replication initiation protein [Caudoviricetes sp.]